MCEASQQPHRNEPDNGLRPHDLTPDGPILLKFWQIDSMFKCPIIGMCLTGSEQKQLLKKAGISIKNKNPFEIHETLVGSSDDQNRLSTKVDNLLRRKFSRRATFLLDLGYQQFMAHWRTVLKTDDFQAALWIAAACPGLPPEYRKEIFGDVHMAMHWTANQSIKLKQKLAVQMEQMDTMQEAANKADAYRRKLKKDNNRLRKSEEKLKSRLASLESQKTQLEEATVELRRQSQVKSLEQENRRLQDVLSEASHDGRQMKRQIVDLETENAFLAEELKHQKELAGHLNQELLDIISSAFDMEPCEESCPTFNLCQKRVLIVGGITRMEALYRRLIEDSGGIFEYHDGYMKKGAKMLENRLLRADMVLCPVNCNSHAACTLVKNLAKKHNKPLHMLANSSLSSVSQVIRGTVDSRNTIN